MGETYVGDAPTIEVLEVALRIGLSMLLGGLVGLEREWRDRDAGLRTHILVAAGACTFTIVSAYGFPGWYEAFEVPVDSPPPTFDPSRIAAGIVTGIGFLGGGVILRSGFGVRGLTTAAGIWATGAVGMAVGAGLYPLGVMAAVVLVFVLTVLRRVDKWLRRVDDSDGPRDAVARVLISAGKGHGRDESQEGGDGEGVRQLLGALAKAGAEVGTLTVRPSPEAGGSDEVTLEMRLPRHGDRGSVTAVLTSVPGVGEVRIAPGRPK